MSQIRRRCAVTVGSLALVVAASACGTERGVESKASGEGVSKAKCVSEATLATKEAKSEKPLFMPEQSFDMSVNEGKSLWLIAVVANESSELLYEGFEAGAKAAGMTTHFASSNGQVTQMQKLVREATTAKASGIVLFNVDPATVSDPLQDAVDQGITVVDFNNGSASDPLDPGIFAHVAFDMEADGKTMGDWILADSGCNTDVALFQLPTYPISTQVIGGAKKEIERLCAKCSTITSDMDIATIGKSLAPLVSTTLRRNPGVKYVNPGFDSFTGLIVPALEQADSDAKLVGHDGLPSTLKAMRGGSSHQVMTAAVPPMQYIGWSLVDQLGRGMADQKSADWTIPSRIIDKTNIGKTDPEVFPAYADYQPHFLKTWKLR